jgi:hypothetical protein
MVTVIAGGGRLIIDDGYLSGHGAVAEQQEQKATE